MSVSTLIQGRSKVPFAIVLSVKNRATPAGSLNSDCISLNSTDAVIFFICFQKDDGNFTVCSQPPFWQKISVKISRHAM